MKTHEAPSKELIPASKFDAAELDALMSGYWLSDLANFSAYISETVPDINWVGFYLSNGQKLKLGPFAGRPACLEISFDHGVCGKAFSQKQPLLVDDVDQFESHIRCDLRSKSEMVIPFVIHGEVVGVLDLDSPSLDRFRAEDLWMMQQALQKLSAKIEAFREAKFGIL